MTTGSYWNVSNPKKPWGPLDPDDAMIVPYDFGEWLAAQGTTYASHNIDADPMLLAETVSQADGEVLVRVSRAVGATPKAGTKYGVTVQVVAADTQKRSKTLYYKIEER